MSVSTLSCHACGGPVSYQAPFCPYCRGPLVWSKQLDIERGEPVTRLDFRRDALPTRPDRAPPTRKLDDGVVVEAAQGTMQWAPVGRPLRDGCVTVRARALDGNGAFGVLARVRSAGYSSMLYQVDVLPAYRSYELQRCVIGPTSHGERLCGWEFSPAIDTTFGFIEVELRFADSLVQVVINGQRVASVVDASFGFGQVGWHVSADAGRTEVVLQSFETFLAR